MIDNGRPRDGGRFARLRGSKGSPKLVIAAGAFALGILALVSAGVAASTNGSRAELLQTAAPSAVAPAAQNAPLASPRLLSEQHQFSFADLVERVAPAVVSVQVDMDARVQTSAMEDNIPEPFRDFFRRFGDSPQGRNFRAPQPRAQAAGSGFIISQDGYIVTNNHVVESARKITVKLSDKREFQAKLIGADKDTDIALLKVETRNLPTVALGDSQRLRVGDWVVAVGNPFGLGGTVTAGIVSSIGRDIGNGPYTDYIQIDAPINRGNSGGPTFDISGQVVGMNTAIFSPSGGSVGIGFAVPASTIKLIVDELKSNGSVNRGWLGVQIQDFNAELASSLGMKDAKGAMVASVVANSPASRAGFAQGDVVVAVNGKAVEDSKAMTRQVAAIRAGEHATFTVLRNGERRNISATIDKRDAERVASADAPRSAEPSALGMSLMPITPSTREQYDLDESATGVVIGSVDPDGEAASKGLREGDVIKRVGSRQVRVPADVTRAIDEAKKAGRDSVLMLIATDQGERFVALKVAQG